MSIRCVTYLQSMCVPGSLGATFCQALKHGHRDAHIDGHLACHGASFWARGHPHQCSMGWMARVRGRSGREARHTARISGSSLKLCAGSISKFRIYRVNMYSFTTTKLTSIFICVIHPVEEPLSLTRHKKLTTTSTSRMHHML